MPHPLLFAALLTLTAATTLALTAEGHPFWARGRTRYPLCITAVAIVNIGLTVLALLQPEPLTGTILLTSALLLVYSAHRRARAPRRTNRRP